jgi:hypothetical protein
MPHRERWWTNGWGIDDRALLDEEQRWLDGRAHPEHPTLAVFIPLAPHYEYFLPPTAAKPFGNDSLFHQYENGLRFTDDNFGALVDAYKQRGWFEDTLFVFVGDHGEAFDQHPRNKLHGSFLYEENLHAPLVLISAKQFHGEVSARIGSHIDLLPTILSLVGVAAPAGLQGQSLVDDGYRAAPVYLSTWYPEPLMGVRDGSLKLIHDLKDGHDELYDLARDPGETTNLAAARPDVVNGYRARLRDFAIRQRARIEDAPVIGERYLARVFATATADVVDEHGARPCTRSGDKLLCGGALDRDQRIDVETTRVFNMERECLRVHVPAHGTLTLTLHHVDPPRTVGVGLTDAARFAKGTPLSARFVVADDDVTLTVDDRFDTTSKATTLAPRTDALDVRIDISSASPSNREACLTLVP